MYVEPPRGQSPLRSYTLATAGAEPTGTGRATTPPHTTSFACAGQPRLLAAGAVLAATRRRARLLLPPLSSSPLRADGTLPRAVRRPTPPPLPATAAGRSHAPVTSPAARSAGRDVLRCAATRRVRGGVPLPPPLFLSFTSPPCVLYLAFCVCGCLSGPRVPTARSPGTGRIGRWAGGVVRCGGGCRPARESMLWVWWTGLALLGAGRGGWGTPRLLPLGAAAAGVFIFFVKRQGAALGPHHSPDHSMEAVIFLCVSSAPLVWVFLLTRS